MPAVVYRGSKKRVERLHCFDELPLSLWLFIAIAAAMLALSCAIIYGAMQRG